MSSKQETFDFVVRFLREQGQAVDENGCRLRTANGRKCAIGCLIPDEQYSPDLENSPFLLVGSQNAATMGSVTIETAVRVGSVRNGTPVGDLLQKLGHHVKLCAHLQYAHDESSWSEGFPAEAFAAVGRHHQLDLAVLDES